MTKEKLKKLIKQFENDPLFPYTLEYTVDMSGYTGENNTFDGTKGTWDGVVSADIKYGCLDNEGKQQYRISKYNYSADVNKDAHPSAEEMYLYGDYAVNFTKMLGHEDDPSCRIITGDTIEYLVRYCEHNSLDLLLSSRGCYETDWDIVEGKNFIGRNCIMIKGTGNELVRFSNYGPNETRFKLNFEALIDSETGMCLYLAASEDQDAEYKVIYEAKSLSIGEDSAVLPTEDEMADMIENCGSVEGDNSVFNTTHTKVSSDSSESGQNEVSISKQEIYDKCISNSMNSVAYTAEIEEIVSERNVAKYWYNNHPDSTETKIKMYSYDDSNNITYIEKYEQYLFSDNTYVSIYDPRETLDGGASNVESTISVGVREPMDGGGIVNILDAFGWFSIITPYNSEYVLSDFSKWDIKGIETYLSRECAVIEGSEIYIDHTDEAITINYTIYVDIETGAWMRLSYNDEKNVEKTIELKRLSIGDEADKPVSKSELKARINKLIDEEGFELYSADDYTVRGRENVDLSILDE